jgi:hypothetical protein
MKTYTHNAAGLVYVCNNSDGTTSSIPPDPNNADYARMLEEVAAGTSEVRDEDGELVEL